MTFQALIACLSLLQVGTAEPVPLFLGPIPSPEGFVAPGNGFRDSYQDLREELTKNREFQRIVRLVADPSEAVLFLEVTGRGLSDTGIRTGSAVATGPTTAVGMSTPVRTKQLFTRLAVRGTEYTLDVDGTAGIRLRTFRNQAKNALQQVVDWVKANRDKLGAR